ncbi:uncharacterized protein LOC126667985 [Mercurialis annua]|uniref:uncharacterized protein LOC126667985 n=1 Tax=Mercurialis annua TaxID=3986 RepID=UPI00215E6861|nr:uncharacterized protein LOC126667985 [Mercurialis annua]
MNGSREQTLANGFNRKAICVIISSLCKEEQYRVQHCTTTKDMWKILGNYHEGIIQVQNKKVELLISEYESFKNKPNETITEITNRLLSITTNLKKLGKHYTLGEINGKILRSLDILDWQPKITAIEESSNMKNLRTDELIGNLLLHEMTYIKEINNLKKAQDEKNKGIALKAKAIESKIEKELNMSDDEDDEDMVLMAKRVREWKLRKKGQFQRYEQKGDSSNFKKPFTPKNEPSNPSPIRDVTCYGCGKPGHTKPDCRVGAKRTFPIKEKKGLAATWDDEVEDSDNECQEEDRANLCFMAFEEESTPKVSPLPFLSWDGIGVETHDSSSNIVVIDNVVNNVDLLDDSIIDDCDDECGMINELNKKCGDYFTKMKGFKKEALMAKVEILNLKKEFQDFKSSLESIPKQDVNILLEENEKLKSEILSLNDSISRFHKGKGALENLLDSQRSPTIKCGLGFSHKNSIPSVTTFVKASSSSTSCKEVPPSMAKPKEVKKKHAQTPKAKPFFAPKPKSKRGARPTRHAHASQYSHKWEKRSMKKNHVHSYPHAYSHTNAHAFSYDFSCAHCYAHSCEVPRVNTHSSYVHMSSRLQCVYCMRYGHKNVNCYVRKVQLRLIPLDYSNANFKGPNVPKKTVSHKTLWYVDSGCSRHMTGQISNFANLKSIDGGSVTFGDDAKGQVVGIGKIGYRVSFDSRACYVIQQMNNEVVFKGYRKGNIYLIDLETLENQDGKCLLSLSDESWLWHRRLGHASLDLLNEVSKDELVKGLPKLKFSKDKVCGPCQKGKQHKSSFKSKNVVSTTRPLQLLHMDLFGPTRFASYAYVIIDDYSRFTWVIIRSDHGTEFQNESFKVFCEENGIDHNFSSPRTP